MLQQQQQLSFEEKVLMTTLSWQKQAEENQRKNAGAITKPVSGQSGHGRQSGSAIFTASTKFQSSAKIKTVDGIQAKQDVSAAYLEKFREKVEFYGNRYYPEAAKQQNLAGKCG